MDGIDAFVLRDYLLFFLLPAWNIVGAVDWWCHRRAGIERFGPFEPMLHLILLSLAGLPMLLGLFLDINALVLLLMILCFVAHEIVGSIDIAWASHGRGIGPFEQRVHDFLTAIPCTALTLVVLFQWRDLIFLVQEPVAALSQPLQLRAPPLSPAAVTVILALVLLCNIVPYVEEFARAWRYRAGTLRRI
jgi:hypothetical protein